MNIKYDEIKTIQESKPEFFCNEQEVGGKIVEIFGSRVIKTDTYNSELSKELRGIVFDKETKECICRPIPKFFNINEKEESKLETFDLEKVMYFSKIDGSLITPVLINNKIFWKSKTSFYSEHAIKAKEIFNSQNNYSFIYNLLKNGITPVFELVSKDYKIVLDYENDSLIYLGERNIKTGEYKPSFSLLTKNITFHDIESMENIEGFVMIQNQKFAKIKTKWYLDRHKITYHYSYKTIVNLIIENKIDDVIGIVSGLSINDKKEFIENLVNEISDRYIEIENFANDNFKLIKNYLKVGYSKKDFALAVKAKVDSKYQSLLFNLEKNYDIDENIRKILKNEYK